MSDAEYILKLIIRARDEFAAVFTKARAEIAGLRAEVNNSAGDFDKLNSKVTSLSLRLNTVKKKIDEARGGLRDLARESTKEFDELGKSVEKAADSVAAHSKVTKAATAASRDAEREFDRLTSAHQKLNEEYRKGTRSQDEYLVGLKRLQTEANRVAKQFDLGSAISDVFTEIGIEAKKSADEVISHEKRKADTIKNLAKERQELERQVTAQAVAAERERARIDAQADRDRKRSAAERQKQADRDVAQQNRLNAARASAAAKEAASEHQRNRDIVNTLRSFDKYNQSLGQRTKLTAQEAAALRAYSTRLTSLRKDTDINSSGFNLLSDAIEMVSSRFRAATAELREHTRVTRQSGGDTNRLAAYFEGVSARIFKAGDSVARLDNQLRGLMVLGILAFAQQLISVFTALGGELLAVASSAAQAAGALGGLAVAGAAQALPVIGLLAGAFHRLSIVQDALKKSDAVRMQTAQRADKQDQQTADNADRIANAQDALRSALENSADAHAAVTDARQKLNQAIKDGRLELEDLIATEKKQELAARGAAIGQKEARDQLRQAIASGTTGTDLQRAELNVAQSNLDAGDASRQSTRARADVAQAGGDVNNLDSVQAARKALADAEKQAINAERSVDRARRGLDQAGEAATKATQGYFAADSQLNYLLGNLSKAERRLFNSIQNIQAVYKKNFRPITDIIINSFTRGVDQAAKLLTDGDIKKSATDLATTLAAQFDRIRKALTQPEMLRQFLRIVAQAKSNLPGLGTIAIRVAKALANIAEAAGPALHDFIGFVGDLAKQFLHLTGNKPKLEDFFKTGEKHLESWIKLGIAVVRLFLAIAGQGGAEEGKKGIDDLTASLDRTTDKINANGEKVKQFFSDARKGTDAVLSVLRKVGSELLKSFDPESVQTFAEFLNKSVIPALGQAIRFTGNFVHVLTKILNVPLISFLAKSLFTFLLFSKTITGLYGALGLFNAQIGHFFRVLGPIATPIKSFRDLSVAIGIGGTKLKEGGKLSSAFGTALEKTGSLGEAAAVRLSKAFKSPLDVFKQLLGHVGDLLRKLPGLNKLLGPAGGGASGIVAGAEGAAGGAAAGEGAAVGAAAGGAARTALMGIIKKAGWIGLGISAGQGIISGFKHHSVRAGFQDFFHSVSFGLIDSADEAAEKAGKRIADKLARGARLNLGTEDRVIRNEKGDVTNRLAGVSTKDSEDLSRLTDDQKRVAKVLSEISKMIDDFNHGRGFNNKLFASLYDQLEDFSKNAPPGFEDALNKMGRAADRVKNTIDAMGDSIKNVNRDVDEGFDLMRRNTDAHLHDIRKTVATSTALIKQRLSDDPEAGGTAMAHAFRRAAEEVQRSMDASGKTTKSGLAQIRRYMIRALTATGHTAQDAESLLDHGVHESAAGAGSSQGGGGAARAVGGWVGKQGERGRDLVHTVLGRGEAVLNWAHQRVVNSALYKTYGIGLSDMFKRTRTMHAGTMSPGFASGGFVAMPGTNFREGSEPAIVAALRKLAQLMHATIYGISGYRSPQHSVSVGGFANDPHTRGSAADIGVNSALRASAAALDDATLRRAGLYRPYYPASAAEINHVELLNGAASKVSDIAGAVASQVIKHIKTPKVTGINGALKSLVNSGLRVATKDANNIIDAANMTGSDVGGATQVAPPGQLRDWITRALKLTNRFSKDNVNALFSRVMFESGGNVKAINLWDSNAKKGIPSKGLAQVIDPTFQSYRLKTLPNDVYNPIANLVAAIRYMIARYGHIVGNTGKGYANGGELPGPNGKPMNILAHAGEWVVNKIQQSRLARLVGTTPDALKSLIGLPHGRRSAATGTVVGGDASGVEDQTTAPLYTSEAEHKRLANIKKGIYELRILPLKNWEDFLTEVKRVFTAIGKTGAAWKARVAEIDKEIGKLKKGGVTKDEAEQIKDLRGERTGLQRNVPGARTAAGADRRINALSALTQDGGLLDQMDTAREKMASKLARELSSLTFKFNKFGKGANRNWNVVANTDKVEIADKALSNSRQALSKVMDEEDDITKAIGDTQSRMAQLRKGGISKKESAEYAALSANLTNLQGRFSDIRDEHFRLLQEVWENQVAAQQAQVDAINKQFGDATEATQRQLSHEGARGGDVTALNKQLRDQNEAYASALEARIASAAAIGNTDLADQLTKQVADLRESIFESLQADVQTAYDQIGADQEGRTRITDLRSRVTDIQERMGTIVNGVFRGGADTVGAARSREAINRTQGDDLKTTRGQFAQLLASQMALPENQRNLTVVKSLNDSIADLDVSIQENTATARDLATATRQAQIDIISGRQGFQGGVFGNLGSLLQAIGQNRGDNSTVGQQLGLLGQQGGLLGQTGGGLRDQLRQAFGIDIGSDVHGEAFASVLSALNFDTIETNMSQAEKEQFESLINAIIENEQAVVDNTQAVDQLNGTVNQPQQFSTTAWQWFRSAIFNGMGDVLPQFEVPSTFGGPVLNRANSTSNVTASNSTGATVNNTTNQDIDINYNEVSDAPSPVETANQVAWATKTGNTQE